MKTLLLTARNHSLLAFEVGGELRLVPSTEVVLTLAEPKYELVENDKVAKYTDYETVRFHATPASLRAAAKSLAEYADECEAVFGKHTEYDDDFEDDDHPLLANLRPDSQPATKDDRYHEADNQIPSDAEFKANVAAIAEMERLKNAAINESVERIRKTGSPFPGFVPVPQPPGIEPEPQADIADHLFDHLGNSPTRSTPRQFVDNNSLVDI